MVEVIPFSGVPRARRELARWLREIADVIDADQAETEPGAALLVLTGSAQHEVLWTGGDHEPGFLRGAARAADAVVRPSYDTYGGNIRDRTHGYRGTAREAQVHKIATHKGEA